MMNRLVRSRSSIASAGLSLTTSNAIFSPNRNALFSTSMLFDDTQIQFKESVEQFAKEHIAPHAESIDRMDNFPKEVNLWKLTGASREILGPCAKRNYGPFL